jgi:hypothetical protein
MLKSFLIENRTAIVDKWIHRAIQTYPSDSISFFESEKNRFANPVGFTISSEISSLYDELIGPMRRDKIEASIDNILKIRAVQDFSPGQAVGFIFGLKDVIREALPKTMPDETVLNDLLEFESRIDALALLAFETYMRCRERVHQIRTREIRMNTARLAGRSGGESTEDKD